jgi:phage terminase large subunit
MSEVAEAAPVQQVVIPYVPRKHFRPLHFSVKRWKFVCAHRRAGKSVAEFNQLLRAALQNTRAFPPPRYAYVGPSFDQTKDLIWGYCKQYAGAIPGVEFREGDLMVILPNGATIRLYGGSAAYERMRGMYFDGIVLDEFPLLNPAVFSTVVRPCLADYRGWAIISGTSNGDDHFHELKKRNEHRPDWDFFIIPVTETDALHPDEVQEMTADMTADEYAREMLCAFDAPIEGSYYGDQLNRMRANNQISGVPWDNTQPVFTAWDLGIHDTMSIWFGQICGREIHWIDYYQNTGQGLDHYSKVLLEKPYTYGPHVVPHDIKARELGTGLSRLEVLNKLLDDVFVCPLHSVEDGIQAVRGILGLSYIDKEKCAAGLSALQNYHKSKTGKPVHNWASHPSDAFRTGSVAFNHVKGMMVGGRRIPTTGPLRRRLRGLM